MSRYKSPELLSLIGDYLDIYLPLDRELSPRTVESYETALRLYDAYLKETGGADGDGAVKGRGLRGATIAHFSGRNVAGFLAWLRDVRGCSRGTIVQRRAAIATFVDYAATKDLASSSLLVEVQRVKIGSKREPQKVAEYMSEEAWDTVVSQPDLSKRTEHRNWVFMVLMYETACRNDEIISLRVKDVILKTGDSKVYIKGKGGKERVIPIRESVAEIVGDYIERFHSGDVASSDPLFYVRHGNEKCKMSHDCSAKFLKRYGRAAREACLEVPENVHPHLIRHTRAMHLREGGMSEADLAELLGHSDSKTTKIYARTSTAMKRKAMERASGKDPAQLARPGFWEGDESVIARLSGSRSQSRF